MTDFLFSKNKRAFQLIIEPIDKLCSYDKNDDSLKNLSPRQKEQLAAKQLINKIYPQEKIDHNAFGAPVLSNNKAISLSHSSTFLACIISKHTAAIDIEPISNKATKVKQRFLNSKELKLAKDDETATLMWCAKECLYKIHQKGKLNFSQDLFIERIDNNNIKCSIFDTEYILYYEKIMQHWLVYYFD